MKFKMALIRHGETENSNNSPFGAGNDTPLSENGKRAIQEKVTAKAYPILRYVYSCGLVCCRDTASLIYPFPVMILKELNMPDAAGHNEPSLQNVLNGKSKATINMESMYNINVEAGNINRKIGADAEMNGAEQCALITRKMVVLEILRRYCVPRSSYEDWKIPFGGGYLIEYDAVQETATALSKI